MFIELDALRDEICKCIFCGLPQASITLTNTLLELAIRVFIQYAQSAGITIDDNLLEPLKYEKRNGKKQPKNTLSNNTKIAFAMGLITEEQKEELNKYRMDFRNNYSHARHETIDNEKMSMYNINISERNFFQIEGTLSDIPMLYGISLYMSAEDSYINYFLNVDYIIRTISSKLLAPK